MKQLSISLLIILFLAGNAIAKPNKQEVLIYSYTEKSTDYTCDFNGFTVDDIDELEWQKSVTTNTGYVVMQSRPAEPVLDVWFLNTWKAKDPNGKMQKYAKPEAPVPYSFTRAHMGSKTAWIINLGSLDEHNLLKGDQKHIWVKALDKNMDLSVTLSGTRNWYYQSGTILHAGSSTMLLKYHSKFTNEYWSDPDMLNAEYAIEIIIGQYLLDKGYKIIPIIL
jgi:hypothetical protein